MRDRFLRNQAKRPLSADELARVFQLLEMQRHLLLMYTSCGWFFDDLAGIETVQILRYAARACELAAALGAPELEAGLVERLAAAHSNRPEVGDGRTLWRTQIEPARVDLARLVGHHAILDVIGDGDDRRGSELERMFAALHAARGVVRGERRCAERGEGAGGLHGGVGVGSGEGLGVRDCLAVGDEQGGED